MAAVVDSAGWGFGLGLMSEVTVLPLFLSHLTPDPLAVGLLRATMLFGWLVPGILVSGWVDRLPRVQVSVLWIAAVERLMLLLMAGLTFWLGTRSRTALLGSFFLCWTIMHSAMGANTPGYYKLIAKTIPAEARGRLYGISGALAGLLGVASAHAGGWCLQRYGFPNGFAICFLATFVIHTLSVLPLGFMREPRQPAADVKERLPSPAATLSLIREDRRLLWLTIAVAAFSVNQMVGGLYSAYAIHHFHANSEQIAELNKLSQAARTAAYLGIGWLADRYGNRGALLAGTGAGIAAGLAALTAGNLGQLSFVFALNEIAGQAWGICTSNYVLELCRAERSATYTAVFSFFSGPFRVGLPLLAGWLAGEAGYGALFGPATVGAMLALGLLLARVPEPRNEAERPATASSPASRGCDS